MLSKKNRGLTKPDFAALYRSGHKIFAPDVKIYWTQSEEELRAGVVVSTKVIKSAVVRNRIRRAIFEAFSANSDRFRKLKIVVVAQPSIVSQNTQQIQNNLITLLEHEKLLAF